MKSSIPISFKMNGYNTSQATSGVKSFEQMVPEFNKGLIASCVITNTISKSREIPALFIIMDFLGNFALLSIYNTSEKVYNSLKLGSHVWVLNPYIKHIQVPYEKNGVTEDVDTKCIQVFELDTIFIDNVSLKSYFQPSQIKNEILQN